jgi:hypothetical protein
MKEKTKNKNKTNNEYIKKTTMLQGKKTIVRGVKKQHPFIQIFKVCWKEPL